jgi:hypothetical protein
LFKAAGGWIFKHFFDDSAIFRELADHYNKDLYRFEFKTVGERNKAIKAPGAARLRGGARGEPQNASVSNETGISQGELRRVEFSL